MSAEELPAPSGWPYLWSLGCFSDWRSLYLVHHSWWTWQVYCGHIIFPFSNNWFTGNLCNVQGSGNFNSDLFSTTLPLTCVERSLVLVMSLGWWHLLLFRGVPLELIMWSSITGVGHLTGVNSIQLTLYQDTLLIWSRAIFWTTQLLIIPCL